MNLQPFRERMSEKVRERIWKGIVGGFEFTALQRNLEEWYMWPYLMFPIAEGKQQLKGLVHDNAHARGLSLQNKFVGSTLNSKSPLPVQSLKILRFIRTSVPLAGLVILR